MLTIATKYIEDSIIAKKIPILTKKPIIGGNPATDKRTILKDKANILFDLFKEYKSVKSLFCFLTYLCFNCNIKKIDQVHKPAIIYTKR